MNVYVKGFLVIVGLFIGLIFVLSLILPKTPKTREIQAEAEIRGPGPVTPDTVDTRNSEAKDVLPQNIAYLKKTPVVVNNQPNLLIQLTALDLCVAPILNKENEQKIGAANIKKYKAEVIAWQKRNFPEMRRQWARNVLRETVWKNDIEVAVNGRNLQLTSFHFSLNKNIAEIQESLWSSLKMLRFKRVEYRTYDGAERYTYYDIDSPGDAELAVSVMKE